MKIKVIRESKLFHFVGKTNDGVEVHMDGDKNIGGKNKGVRPMEMLLYGLAGCSGIDIVSILSKQRQNLEHIEIEIEAEREKEKYPSLFTKINVKFFLKGNLNIIKVQKALKLVFDKYCSVAKTLDKFSKISYSFEIISN